MPGYNHGCQGSLRQAGRQASQLGQTEEEEEEEASQTLPGKRRGLVHVATTSQSRVRASQERSLEATADSRPASGPKPVGRLWAGPSPSAPGGAAGSPHGTRSTPTGPAALPAAAAAAAFLGPAPPLQGLPFLRAVGQHGSVAVLGFCGGKTALREARPARPSPLSRALACRGAAVTPGPSQPASQRRSLDARPGPAGEEGSPGEGSSRATCPRGEKGRGGLPAGGALFPGGPGGLPRSRRSRNSAASSSIWMFSHTCAAAAILPGWPARPLASPQRRRRRRRPSARLCLPHLSLTDSAQPSPPLATAAQPATRPARPRLAGRRCFRSPFPLIGPSRDRKHQPAPPPQVQALARSLGGASPR